MMMIWAVVLHVPNVVQLSVNSFMSIKNEYQINLHIHIPLPSKVTLHDLSYSSMGVIYQCSCHFYPCTAGTVGDIFLVELCHHIPLTLLNIMHSIFWSSLTYRCTCEYYIVGSIVQYLILLDVGMHSIVSMVAVLNILSYALHTWFWSA